MSKRAIVREELLERDTFGNLVAPDHCAVGDYVDLIRDLPGSPAVECVVWMQDREELHVILLPVHEVEAE